MSETTPSPARLTRACATVRESMRATETDLNDAAEQAQFAKDYGTDADIQRHVLDWAYMYEAPAQADLDADPAYAAFIDAWTYIMAHGVHPAASAEAEAEPEDPIYNVYTLTDGMVGDEESANTIEEARAIFDRFIASEWDAQRSAETYSETSVHLYCPGWGDMVAETCIPAKF